MTVCRAHARAGAALLTMLLLCAGTAFSAEGDAGARPAKSESADSRWSGYSDLFATFNPKGISATGGLEYRDAYQHDKKTAEESAYWTAGAGAGLSPAYAQPSVALEWMPAPFIVGRLQYDRYYYFGANGGLLSFGSARDAFGDPELRARKGTEETGVGSRVLFQPTVQVKAGELVIRNQSDLARYRFPGSGPYFLVQEYDTLLRNDGRLFANRTQVLKEFRKNNETLFFGPYYEIVRGAAGTVTRRQLGVIFYSEERKGKPARGESHYVAELGYDITDRNREGTLFLLIGIGFSSVL